MIEWIMTVLDLFFLANVVLLDTAILCFAVDCSIHYLRFVHVWVKLLKEMLCSGSGSETLIRRNAEHMHFSVPADEALQCTLSFFEKVSFTVTVIVSHSQKNFTRGSFMVLLNVLKFRFLEPCNCR